MKNKLEKHLRSFIGSDYSKRTIDRFHRWMISPDSAEEKETALRNLWLKTKGKSEHGMEHSFRQILDKIGIEYTSTVASTNCRNWWKPVAAAAVIVLLSVTATLWVSINHLDKDNVVMVEHYVHSGDRETISLPDGTIIHLNSGSYVFYPENLKGKNRMVYLVGEAEFNVARNPNKPFIVRSSNMTITALGTEFNVKAYPEEDIITASLIEGKVQVDCNDTISYILTPGYQVVYNKYTADSKMLTANMKDVTAWMRGELVFDKVTLAEIIRTLERHYGIAFHISTKKYNQDHYNFVFRKDATLKETLEVMKVVIEQFDYRLEDDICYII